MIIDHNSLDKLTLKDKGAWHLYFLYYQNELVYIGQTNDLYGRLLQHVYDKYFDTFSAIPTSSTDIDEFEKQNIIHYKPYYNRDYVRDCGFIMEKGLASYFRSDGDYLKRVLFECDTPYIVDKTIKDHNFYFVQNVSSFILDNYKLESQNILKHSQTNNIFRCGFGEAGSLYKRCGQVINKCNS